MLDIVELSLVSTIFCEWRAVPPGLHRIIIEMAQKNNQELHAIPSCAACLMANNMPNCGIASALLPRPSGFVRQGPRNRLPKAC